MTAEELKLQFAEKWGWNIEYDISAFDECLSDLNALIEKVIEEKWISITDRMPDSGFCVLLFSKSGGVAEGAWLSSKGYFEQWRWNAILSDVTHWMPLPTAPGELLKNKLEGGSK